MTDDPYLIQRLRRRLGVYFLSYDAMRDLGRGTAFPASADLPGGLQTDDRFFRTDLDMACVYDGTRWLTVHENDANVSVQTITTSPTLIPFAPLRQDYAPYVTRCTTEYRVATTNNGSNYWTINVRGLNAAYGTATTIHQFTTASVAAGTYNSNDAAPSATATPSNRAFLELQATMTGAPGTLTVLCTVYYRLIVT